jgi:hypothetical protein
MKKLILSLSAIALLALPSVKAQFINPDFETWTHTAGPPAYDDPNTALTNNGWQELNFTSQALAGSSPISVFKDSSLNTITPFHGNYCAEIKTVILSATTIALAGKYLPNDTLGVLFTGQINVSLAKIATKIPFNLPVPMHYNFYYQYYPVGGDSAFCLVSYSRHDTVIAVGKTYIGALTNTWTLGQVTPLVLKGGLPDSIAIWFSSSSWVHTHPHAGSELYVDDATNTGIPSIFGNNDAVVVYPNPARNEVTISISGNIQANLVEVYDMTGKAIGAYSMHNNLLTVNTQSFNSGIYFYRLLDNTGNQLKTGKFSVVK